MVGQRRHRWSIRAIVSATAMLIATLGATVVTAAPAQAAVSCSGWSHGANGPGSGIMTKTANLKVGPYAACGNVASVANGKRVYYHCFIQNDYGNIWMWVRVQGTSTQGWMSAANFRDEDFAEQVEYCV